MDKQVLLFYFSQNYILTTDSLRISTTAWTLHPNACSSSRLYELKHCVSSSVELWWLCVVTHSAASPTSQKWEIMCLQLHHSAGAKSELSIRWLLHTLGVGGAQLNYPCQGVDGSLFLSNQTTLSCFYLPPNVVCSRVAAVVGYSLLGITFTSNIKECLGGSYYAKPHGRLI